MHVHARSSFACPFVPRSFHVTLASLPPSLSTIHPIKFNFDAARRPFLRPPRISETGPSITHRGPCDRRYNCPGQQPIYPPSFAVLTSLDCSCPVDREFCNFDSYSYLCVCVRRLRVVGWNKGWFVRVFKIRNRDYSVVEFFFLFLRLTRTLFEIFYDS